MFDNLNNKKGAVPGKANLGLLEKIIKVPFSYGGCFFLLIGFVMLIGGLSPLLSNVQLLFSGEHTTGIVFQEENGIDQGKLFVRFETLDGAEIKYTPTIHMEGFDLPLGGEVEVIYKKDDPHVAVVNDIGQLWVTPLFFVFIGGMLFAIAIQFLRGIWGKKIFSAQMIEGYRNMPLGSGATKESSKEAAMSKSKDSFMDSGRVFEGKSRSSDRALAPSMNLATSPANDRHATSSGQDTSQANRFSPEQKAYIKKIFMQNNISMQFIILTIIGLIIFGVVVYLFIDKYYVYSGGRADSSIGDFLFSAESAEMFPIVLFAVLFLLIGLGGVGYSVLRARNNRELKMSGRKIIGTVSGSEYSNTKVNNIRGCRIIVSCAREEAEINGINAISGLEENSDIVVFKSEPYYAIGIHELVQYGGKVDVYLDSTNHKKYFVDMESLRWGG